MPNKRSRTTRSCVHLEKEVVSVDVEKQPVEQPSSSVGARNKAARTSMTMDHLVNPPPALDQEVIFTIASPPPLSPQQTLPAQIHLHGGGFPVDTNPLLPPTFLDICNYCKKRIQSDENMHMNGGLGTYCSPACRDNFNNMMQATENRSPESEQSINHFQWKNKK